MNVTHTSLNIVDSHWAVLAVGAAKRDRGLKVVDVRLVRKALGPWMTINFEDRPTDDDLLRKLAIAYEIVAIEGLSGFTSTDTNAKELQIKCASGAYRAFEIRRIFKIPENNEERIYHILHLSALAYCGDRWSDLRRWYNENSESIQLPPVENAAWNYRLLYRLFDCWVRLLRKEGWDDIDRINQIISDLREDQNTYESGVLDSDSDAENRFMAFRLLGMYHWAKGTELLAEYIMHGRPVDISTRLDKHFETAIESAKSGSDAQLEILLRWLHATSRQMVSGSIWWVARTENSRVTAFVKELTQQQALFELLPPQRAALQEQGLLDQAATAIVIDMPTSGGKTLLAQFRILQALNAFDRDNGWVAYVAPTRALTAQITRRLRRDFAPINVRVEQLTGAVEIDTFENDLLESTDVATSFNVLVATPEKLQLVIRNKKVPRPLALVVMDEAHNIENESRGLRIELLLASIKRECLTAKFLLLMPYVERTETLARWLANDIHAGRAISFGTTIWKPNERIVGIYHAVEDSSVNAGWRLVYQTLTTTPNTITLSGTHSVGQVKPLPLPKSKVISNLSVQTAAIASVLAGRGTSIAVAKTIRDTWTMARQLDRAFSSLSPIPPEIVLVQNYLKTEVSPNFELIEMLSKGIGVHHAGLSDEIRALIEWLAEEGKLRVLCATTTIAQGINFPVSSVFLSSRYVYNEPRSIEMPPRDFWNLAGRAGRMKHDSVGVVGLAAGNNPDEIVEYVKKATGELASQLVELLNELEDRGQLHNLQVVIQEKQWEDFRCYVTHLWNDVKNLQVVLSDTEQLLRNTYGYNVLRASENGREKADKLLEVTKNYARWLADNSEYAEMADMTGFSPEGVKEAIIGLNELEHHLTPDDWSPESLFGSTSDMADLYGVMLKVPKLAESLKKIGGEGTEFEHISNLTSDWVNGKTIQEIAQAYFGGDENQTHAITQASKAIYQNLVNSGTWGFSALSHLSGFDFEGLSDTQRRKINAIPAMVYYGVKTEDAVLMRMNAVPRSVAEKLGHAYRASLRDVSENRGLQEARSFIKNLDASGWHRARPTNAHMTGGEYKQIWEILSGEKR
jgi:replicative superfamily II helicase